MSSLILYSYFGIIQVNGELPKYWYAKHCALVPLLYCMNSVWNAERHTSHHTRAPTPQTHGSTACVHPFSLKLRCYTGTRAAIKVGVCLDSKSSPQQVRVLAHGQQGRPIEQRLRLTHTGAQGAFLF